MNNGTIKKVSTIAIVVLVLAAIGIGVYFGIQNAKKSIIPGGQSSEGSGSFPVSSGGGGGFGSVAGGQGEQPSQSGSSGGVADQNQKSNLFQLTTNPAIGFWTASSSSSSPSGIMHAAVYYLNPNGDVVQVQDVGKEQVITGSSLGTPVDLWHSSNGLYAVALYNSGAYALFSVQTKAWQPLPGGLTGIAFSPDSTKLAMLKEENGQTTISIMNLATARRTISTIMTFNVVDVAVAWPVANRLFIISHPASGVDGQAWYINPQTKSLTYFAHGNGLQMVFDPVRPYYSAEFVVSENKTATKVVFVDDAGNVVDSVQVSTLADKCTFSPDGSHFICGVPRENDKGADINLLDDYLQRGVYFHDSLYDFSGSQFSVITPLLTASDVFLDVASPQIIGSQLFFMNRLDHTLYLYNLPTS